MAQELTSRAAADHAPGPRHGVFRTAAPLGCTDQDTQAMAAAYRPVISWADQELEAEAGRVKHGPLTYAQGAGFDTRRSQCIPSRPPWTKGSDRAVSAPNNPRCQRVPGDLDGVGPAQGNATGSST